MGHGTFAERDKVVSALEARNDPSATMPIRQCDEFAGQPCVIVRVQTHLRQRIAGMGIEPGRDKQQIGREPIDGGKQIARPCRSELAAATARPPEAGLGSARAPRATPRLRRWAAPARQSAHVPVL